MPAGFRTLVPPRKLDWSCPDGTKAAGDLYFFSSTFYTYLSFLARYSIFLMLTPAGDLNTLLPFLSFLFFFYVWRTVVVVFPPEIERGMAQHLKKGTFSATESAIRGTLFVEFVLNPLNMLLLCVHAYPDLFIIPFLSLMPMLTQ